MRGMAPERAAVARSPGSDVPPADSGRGRARDRQRRPQIAMDYN
jgi:hypothetical protein